MNRVTLIGNVVRDLELKNYNNLEEKGSYVQFTLAINDYRNKEKEAVFINVVSFGKQGEVLAKYLAKGRRIAIEGKLNNVSYVNSKGEKKHSLNVILEEFQFLDKKQENVI